MHKIRRRIVFEVLQFYKDNNNLYSGVTSAEARNDESAAPTPEGMGGNESITDFFLTFLIKMETWKPKPVENRKIFEV
jgi:hypothetical protein